MNSAPDDVAPPRPEGPSRRTVMTGAALGAAWILIGRVDRAEAVATDLPPGFPPGVDLHKDVFRNWDTTITTESLWTSTAEGADDVVAVANWAVATGYRVRPVGFSHSWSPLVVEDGTAANENIVLIDTSKLAAMSMDTADRVRVQAGASMESLLEFLSAHDRCLIGAPAPGDVSVAGVLAVSGHGTNLPAEGEATPPGATYGTVSNTVVELTVVVWDDVRDSFVVRTFHRSDPQIAPLLVNLGRAVILEAVLQTVPNYHLRCRNSTSTSYRELFAPPDEAGDRSLSALVERHGRVGLIWFAMTEFPWVQTWDVTERRPLLSRPVYAPYNFPFADNLPDSVSFLIAEITKGAWHLTPTATNAQLTAAAAGLVATGATDMWGEAKNFIHFVKPTTLKVSAGSHVVITRRDLIQHVVHGFTDHYLRLIDKFRCDGDYPANNTCEIRVTGLDRPEDIGIPGAATATLSAVAPVAERPELDTAVWLDVLNLPGSPRTHELFMGLEAWFHELPPELGVARPEWAKRFATSLDGSWTDTEALRTTIPRAIAGWDEALAALDRWDPHGVFRADLHDRLMP
ncbi:cholesterol oxidase substrate-binding domain-containing protein [Myceligenerans pegani]|uniref:FAD-binding protein n=1 Tax=Myceligenerans pegani TaxID=2776917 RepID=A0ABR9MTD6_9MICO|nr:cholesterol oxidase substrate-binding domain-containing protein [Myceligenerans sp. TRM 65318]MBE1874209.1 FAD-binding protein [Myceligenerans sp. TRM 65318]MBE3016481.1 FAD-binding protein [Myceligenerans sp. TRM 65318]